jgi:hypothetical protein
MVFVQGRIDDLVEWFEWQHQFDVLFLYLVGNLSDKEFIKSVLANREILDVISGERIAVLLFAPGNVSALRLHRAGGLPFSRPTEVDFPAELISRGAEWTSEHDPHRIDPANTEDVLQASHSIAHEIVQHFHLDATSLSSFLVLVRGEKEPSAQYQGSC